MMRAIWPLLTILSVPTFAADRVLVVTATAGFRHDSIETAESVIAEIANQMNSFEVTFVRTEDAMTQAFTGENLKSVKLVMFVNTTGELAPATRSELLRWVVNGGSFLGAHSAADTWHDSPDYIDMLGGEFLTHPAETTVEVFTHPSDHPAILGLESPHLLFEEIYLFRNFHLDHVQMLLSLRASPESGSPGFFPLAWYKNYGAGRVLYTALGHRSDVWTSDWFRQHLTGAIRWGLQRGPLPRRRAVQRESRLGGMVDFMVGDVP